MSENFSGGSLVDWRLALQEHDPALAAQLHEEQNPYKAVAELGLPTPLYVEFESATPFLDSPQTYLESLEGSGVSAFYVGLRPKVLDLPKYRELGLRGDQVDQYIRRSINPADYDKYSLRVAEYAEAEYGGIMVINQSGKISVELAKGEMANLATGVQTPEYVAGSTPFTRLMRYSFENPELREATWRTISAVPSTDNGTFRPNYLAGYYEFSLIRRAKRLTPVFFDYKNSSVFSTPD